jgi:hypothetical protein
VVDHVPLDGEANGGYRGRDGLVDGIGIGREGMGGVGETAFLVGGGEGVGGLDCPLADGRECRRHAVARKRLCKRRQHGGIF